jgi:hypothetical protein
MDRAMKPERKLALSLKALRRLIFAAMQFRFGMPIKR